MEPAFGHLQTAFGSSHDVGALAHATKRMPQWSKPLVPILICAFEHAKLGDWKRQLFVTPSQGWSLVWWDFTFSPDHHPPNRHYGPAAFRHHLQTLAAHPAGWATLAAHPALQEPLCRIACRNRYELMCNYILNTLTKYFHINYIRIVIILVSATSLRVHIYAVAVSSSSSCPLNWYGFSQRHLLCYT